MGRHGPVAAMVVVLLLVVATVSLRGNVPGVGPVPRESSADSPASLAFLVGLVVAAAAVVAMAVVTRWRQVGTSGPSAAGRPDWFRSGGERPSRRTVLIAFVVVVAWLLAVALLGSLGGGGNRSDSESLQTHEGKAPDASSTTAPATPPPQPAPPQRPAPPDDTSHLLGYLFAATALFLLVLVIASVRAARARRRLEAWAPVVDEESPRPSPDAASEFLARAAEVGLAEVYDPSRDPRAAIIACYVAMERELARVPDAVPQDFDTASEVLERAVQRHALGPDSATELVELFDEARFSHHVMNEGHREVAGQALQRVVGEIRSLT